MEEYRSIINSSKAPRKSMIAFDKIDGSNVRARYTPKNGFCMFGNRTSLLDEDTVHITKDGRKWYWGQVVTEFKKLEQPLTKLFRSKEFRDFKEITVFGEFHGENSAYGDHDWNEPHKVTVFDVLVGDRERKLIPPREFVKIIGNEVEIPRVVFEGNLTDQFISDVRDGLYGVDEGVICKGTEKTGAFFGHIWQCKIKTQDYYNRIYARFGEAGAKLLWE